MRKIERAMCDAITSGHNWSSSNTQVVFTHGQLASAWVFLHGNHIATVTPGWVELFDGGWQTVTTKSRLNAILDTFSFGSGVFQKNWDWFVRDFKSGDVFPFVDGFSVRRND